MYNSLFDIIFNDLHDSSAFKSDSVKSCGDIYKATVVIPGVKKDQIYISATSDYLKIFLKEKEDKKLLKKISLGGLVDIKSISSKLEDGVLEVVLPKNEVSESVEIKIK